MQRYVCGFAFWAGEVLLIRKIKPAWQAGRLNGIGGKIEEGETPHEAMVREFREETGLEVPDWQHFATLSGEGWEVYFFRGVYPLGEARTMEAEEIVRVPFAALPREVLPNVPYLIALAQTLRQRDLPLQIREARP